MNFDTNSTLDNKDYSLFEVPHLMGHKLCDIFLLAQEISRFIESCDSIKSTGLDKFPVVILKNLGP